MLVEEDRLVTLRLCVLQNSRLEQSGTYATMKVMLEEQNDYLSLLPSGAPDTTLLFSLSSLLISTGLEVGRRVRTQLVESGKE